MTCRVKCQKARTSGFTVLELIIVITVIGILAAISVISFNGITAKSRNYQKSTNITSLAEALEVYYEKNGEYPSCTALSQSPQTVKLNTLPDINIIILTAPSAESGINSILPLCAQLSDNSNIQYSYVGDGSEKCLTGLSCSEFTLKYREENTGNIIIIKSRRNIAMSEIVKYNLIVITGLNGIVTSGGVFDSGSTQNITAAPNAFFIFDNWTGSTGCSGIASHMILMNANKTCTANFIQDPNWMTGIASTALAGKYIRSTDLSTTHQFKTSNTGITAPQGAIGLDPNYPTIMSLVNPQNNPDIDFSAYPAQNACKAIGGRLPNMQELLAFYTNRIAYGNNFTAYIYWPSTELRIDTVHYVNFYDGAITGYSIGKISTMNVRCVSG